MTIYVVYYQNFDDFDICEAYRSEEAAKRAIREDHGNNWDGFHIKKVTLY